MGNERFEKQDQKLFYHVEQLQKGNLESYNEIYALSGKYLYKIIYDIVQDHHTTEDMLQETFIKIYNNIGSLQSPQAFYVWAGRVATNLCIRYRHKYRNEMLQNATDDGEGNEEFLFDTVADDNEMFIPESVLDNSEHQRMIGEVIDRLSPEQKLAVQCFYFEEMSVKEIAQAMECSEGTIKSRLNYARKSIKEAVLHIEKTQGTKLYSLGGLPLLWFLFRGMAETTVPEAAVANASANAMAATAESTVLGNTYGASMPLGEVSPASQDNGEMHKTECVQDIREINHEEGKINQQYAVTVPVKKNKSVNLFLTIFIAVVLVVGVIGSVIGSDVFHSLMDFENVGDSEENSTDKDEQSEYKSEESEVSSEENSEVNSEENTQDNIEDNTEESEEESSEDAVTEESTGIDFSKMVKVNLGTLRIYYNNDYSISNSKGKVPDYYGYRAEIGSEGYIKDTTNGEGNRDEANFVSHPEFEESGEVVPIWMYEANGM